jgi:hypothetical protein
VIVKRDNKLIWTIRRRIVAQLESAPTERQAGLRAALRGIDMLLRTNFDIRQGGRWRAVAGEQELTAYPP